MLGSWFAQPLSLDVGSLPVHKLTDRTITRRLQFCDYVNHRTPHRAKPPVEENRWVLRCDRVVFVPKRKAKKLESVSLQESANARRIDNSNKDIRDVLASGLHQAPQEENGEHTAVARLRVYHRPRDLPNGAATLK